MGVSPTAPNGDEDEDEDEECDETAPLLFARVEEQDAIDALTLTLPWVLTHHPALAWAMICTLTKH